MPTVARKLKPCEQRLERETGFEPATSTLARSHSTTELFPLFGENSAYHSDLCPIKNADVCRDAFGNPAARTTQRAPGPARRSGGAGDTSGQVTLVPGGPVALSAIVALKRPQPAWTLTGGAGAGVVQTAGNTQVNNVRLSGDLVATGAVDRYSFAGIVTHANDRGIETARNWSGTGKYDRFLTARLFANANTNFTNDRFRDIDLRTALGAGIGYQILQTTRTTLTADAGLAWVNENFRTIADDSYAAAHESAGLQLQLVPDRAQFFHLHDGYFGVSGDDKMFIRTQNGVRIGLAAGFVTTIEEDLDYDRRPSPGRRQTDRTFSLTLGYRF